MIYIARITAAVDAAGNTQTLLFGNVDWTTGPSDTPPNAPVRGRLIEPGNLKRDMGAGQSLFGAVRPGYGVATVQISDGSLDALARYGWGWRAYELWGIESDGYTALPAFPAGWSLLLAATVESAEATESELRLTLRDRLALLAKPVCQLYTGGGGTGGHAQLAGQPRPYVVGQAANMEPVLISPNDLIYDVGSGPCIEPRNVYDMRSSLTPYSSGRNDAPDFAGLAALTLTAPKFARASDAHLFRVAAPPAGRVTADVIRNGPTYPTSYGRCLIGQVLNDVALDAGLTGADIDPALSALDASGGPVQGYFVRDTSTTFLDVLGALAASRGAWVGCNRSGVLTAGIVAAPSGTPVWTFRDAPSYGIARVAGAFPVPAKSVTVRGGRNWTPMQPADVAGISMGELTAIAQQFTASESATSTAALQHLNAPDVTVDTCSGSVSTVSPQLPGATLGQSAAQWIALFGAVRDTFEVTVQITLALLAAVDLGSVVQVKWPRFGLDAGKLMLCIGVRLSFAQQRATFVLWG